VNAFQYHLHNVRFRADAGGIPEAFALFFGGIAPRRLSKFETFLNRLFRFAQHHGYILEGMQAVADEERDHHDIFCLRKMVALSNARLFFHENRMDGSVNILRPDQLNLMLNGFAGIFVLAGSVTGDEERRFGGLWFARERKLLHHFPSAGEQDLGHAVVRANRAAVKKSLFTALFYKRMALDFGFWALDFESQFAREDFLGEIAFANEERHNENSGRKNSAQHLREIWFLFPERFLDLRENFSPAQIVGVLVSGRGGIGIQRRAVTGQDQSRV